MAAAGASRSMINSSPIASPPRNRTATSQQSARNGPGCNARFGVTPGARRGLGWSEPGGTRWHPGQRCSPDVRRGPGSRPIGPVDPRVGRRAMSRAVPARSPAHRTPGRARPRRCGPSAASREPWCSTARPGSARPTSPRCWRPSSPISGRRSGSSPRLASMRIPLGALAPLLPVLPQPGTADLARSGADDLSLLRHATDAITALGGGGRPRARGRRRPVPRPHLGTGGGAARREPHHRRAAHRAIDRAGARAHRGAVARR